MSRSSSGEPLTFFGTWSKSKFDAVSQMLREKGVRFQGEPFKSTEANLREWAAWESEASDPYIGVDLWIHSDDLELVGTSIVDRFPERKFEKGQ